MAEVASAPQEASQGSLVASVASAVKAIAADPLMWRLLGACSFVVHDASEWKLLHYVLWTLAINAGMEILAWIAMVTGKVTGMDKPEGQIKDRAKRLLAFEAIDVTYIVINKLFTALFTYHCAKFLWRTGTVSWSLDRQALLWTLPSLLALYWLYDLGYATFHRILHVPSLYPYVHKHHHRQHAPYRGNLDAINVHPFEFVIGEYNHLFCIWAVGEAMSRYAGVQLPLLAVAIFIILGGILASLNHTRFNIQLDLPLLGWKLFHVQFHDLHHVDFYYNYGQYTMWMDWAMGTYRPKPLEEKEQ